MSTIQNILFILTDQLRWDYLSCYGHPHLHTPNIDWLAENRMPLSLSWNVATFRRELTCVCYLRNESPAHLIFVNSKLRGRDTLRTDMRNCPRVSGCSIQHHADSEQGESDLVLGQCGSPSRTCCHSASLVAHITTGTRCGGCRQFCSALLLFVLLRLCLIAFHAAIARHGGPC